MFFMVDTFLLYLSFTKVIFFFAQVAIIQTHRKIIFVAFGLFAVGF